ncbi:MAG: cytochrome P450 [Candidatus Azotimanducaceae bacterium]|jgi:cytochrome P450
MMLDQKMNYLAQFDALNKRSPAAASNLLFSWLQDDDKRPELLHELARSRPVLKFQTRASGGGKKQDGTVRIGVDSEAPAEDGLLSRSGPPDLSVPVDLPSYGDVLASGVTLKVPKPNSAYLLTGRANIDDALTEMSNEPYSEIGEGDFVLGLDGETHKAHRVTLMNTLQRTAQKDPHALMREVHLVSWLAAKNALVLPSKKERFDLVEDVAEQGALRFVAGFFGFPDTEHARLQETMRMSLKAMIYQMYGRHFVTDPSAIPRGQAGMAVLAKLVGDLLDEAGQNSIALRLFKAVADDVGAVDALKQLGRELIELEMPQEFQVIADKLAAFEDKENWSVDESSEPIATGLLIAADYIDQLINVPTVREHILYGQTGLDKSSALGEFLAEIVDERQERDDHLVPRKIISSEDGITRPRKTLIERLALEETQQHGIDMATTVVGTIAGLVGNITAGVCNTLNELMKSPERMDQARAAAALPDSLDSDNFVLATKGAVALCDFVEEALRLHPPAVFIPRRMSKKPHTFFGSREVVPLGADIIIPLGSATRDGPDNPDEFELGRPKSDGAHVFGHESSDESSHRCLGEFITLPLIAHIVRQVLALDGLAKTMSDDGVTENKLEKEWGYICKSFPLTHNRGANLKQRPLNVVMKIRTPFAEHAEALKLVIHHGAPLVENLLRQSNIVHFARFVFLNNDTELGLFTTYDGDFETYIRFFAEAAGPVFDLIFEHIDHPPPSPVRNNPTAFVEHIRLYDVASAGGYFFSAAPMEVVDHD